MQNYLLEHVEAKHLRADAPQFDIGDIVDVHCRIVEGDKERIQIFSGTVIMRKGHGINETFTVRRIVNNEGVERIFPLHSPKIEKLDVRRKSRVRRAKLYYLRERTGKATRLREGDPIVPGETIVTKNEVAKPAQTPAPAEKPAPAAPKA
jgi:large subunit ribosomal protein L19